MSRAGSPDAADRVEDEGRVFDLAPIYPSEKSWAEACAALEADLPRLETHRGRLREEGAGCLLDTLETLSDLEQRIHRLHTYASLLSDIDLRESSPQGMRQRVEALFADFSARSSWIDPEILSLDPSTIASWIEQEPGLRPYARVLEKLEKRRPHTLDGRSEELLGHTGLLRGTGATFSGQLKNAEIPWPTIETEDGKSSRVDAIGYARLRQSPEREDRRRAFEAFFSTLRTYRGSLATSVYASAKEHVFSSRVRRYEGTLESALHANEVDPAVYHMLVDEVNASLDTLQRYLRLRARILGIDDLGYHDNYAPLVAERAGAYGWEAARELTLEALTPLGADYVARLREALRGTWIDVDPREGKRSGAYVNDGAYGVHPYMLLNHQEDVNSVSTLAHEAGHLMHSLFSQERQPYPTSRYVIFVAEVASTFNEALLFHHLLERTDADDARLSLLGHYLDNLRATVFRQTMFAEFELAFHREAEKNQPLTADVLEALYLDLLRRYHGHESEAMRIDDIYGIEWAYVPHFHYNFYVYQYATSFVAATALSRRVLDGDGDALRSYRDFLGRGSEAPPVELLRDAGVDMTSPEPIRATMREMTEVMDAMEAILESRKDGA